MKRIIYTAVALIICASVFGIADYLDAKNNGSLVNYSDDVQTTEAFISEKKTEITTPVKEELQTVKPKNEFKKQAKAEKKYAQRKVQDPHYIDIIPNLAVSEKTKDFAPEKIEPIAIIQSKTTDGNKTDSTIQVNNKRKISMEMFSRAPIREKKITVKK